MIVDGRVNATLEPILRISMRSAPGRGVDVDALVDTGFNGSPALTRAMVSALELEYLAATKATIGDGREVHFATYLATVEWMGRLQDVSVLESEGGPLIGMGLLQGCTLWIDVQPGGAVRVTNLPSEIKPVIEEQK